MHDADWTVSNTVELFEIVRNEIEWQMAVASLKAPGGARLQMTETSHLAPALPLSSVDRSGVPSMRLLSPWLALLLLSAATSLWAAEPVRSVPALDMGRYAGQWHEIAHLPVSFQKKCVGEITATYALRSDGRISVHNACRIADGGRIAAEGVARPVEGHPGRLQVRFVPDWLAWVPLVWADYWVIALDPDYQWAVVGDPAHNYLWILSRSPSMDSALFARLKARAEAMGYDLAPLKVMAPLD